MDTQTDRWIGTEIQRCIDTYVEEEIQIETERDK
jgi:hypothetical protein